MSTQLATQADLSQAGLPARLTEGMASDDLDAALKRRSATALGYIKASSLQYVLPLISWGDDLRLAVCQLAAWDLVGVQIGLNASADDLSFWRDRRDEALAWLRDVQAGKVVPDEIVDSSASSIAPDVTMTIVSDPPLGW